MSLAWPWSGRSILEGNQWEYWHPGLGPNVVGPQFSCHQWCDHLTGWHFLHMAGWLVNYSWLVGWLTGYLIKCQPDPPGRDILCPSVILLHLWVRLTFGQMYPLPETSCGQVCYYCGQVDLWSDVPPRGLLHKRPFTQKSNYLINLFLSQLLHIFGFITFIHICNVLCFSWDYWEFPILLCFVMS